MSRYQIATFAQGVAGLKDLCELVREEPQSTYQPYTEAVGSDLTGAPIEAGLPVAAWSWDWLSQDDIDQLQQYCSGMSAQVYIRMPKDSGTRRVSGTFLAVMHRPKLGSPEDRETGNQSTPQARPVEITFTMLEAQ